MPIYEYTCTDCGHNFEYLARTLKDTPAKCPECGSESLKKQFSTFRAESTGDSCDCAHADHCSHSHGAGCGCGCCS